MCCSSSLGWQSSDCVQLFAICSHFLPWMCYARVSFFCKYLSSTSVLWSWRWGADLACAWPLWPHFLVQLPWRQKIVPAGEASNMYVAPLIFQCLWRCLRVNARQKCRPPSKCILLHTVFFNAFQSTVIRQVISGWKRYCQSLDFCAH